MAEIESRSRTVEVAGRLEPESRISHNAPIAGIVRRVEVEPGARVSTGKVLFTIERDEVGRTYRPVPVAARVGGVVSEVLLQPEQQVRAGDAGVVVVGRDGYVLEAQISDKDAGAVAVGQVVSARSSTGARVQGRLAVRSQEPDYETGLFSLTFRFPNTDGVGIGSFLVVELPTRTTQGVFVPRDAVDRRYGRYFLWVVDEAEGVIRRQEATLGEIIGEEVLVEDGLEPGMRYLLELTGAEREGDPAPPRPDGGDGGAGGAGASDANSSGGEG
jgi:multidrug efflux pump subunit AcrA (membrane-fusion protein)